MHIDEQGLVVGLTYSVISPSCGSAPSTSASSSPKAPHSLSTHLSRPLIVVVDTPAFAPALESTIAPAPPLSGPSALLNFGANLGGAVPAGESGPGSVVGGKPGAKVPVPDDRSWLAKNWMFVLGACMMVSGGGLTVVIRFDEGGGVDDPCRCVLVCGCGRHTMAVQGCGDA